MQCIVLLSCPLSIISLSAGNVNVLPKGTVSFEDVQDGTFTGIIRWHSYYIAVKFIFSIVGACACDTHTHTHTHIYNYAHTRIHPPTPTQHAC